MPAPNAPSEKREIRCPACGHAINTTTGPRRRRVQCPKCREVIDLTPPETTPSPAQMRLPDPPEPPETPVPTPPAPRPREIAALIERIAALESRLSAVEKFFTPAVSPAPVGATPASPASALRWSRERAYVDTPALAPEFESNLVHNLATMRPRPIVLYCASGSANAHWHADQLKHVFQRAHWPVDGPRERQRIGEDHGVALIVGSLPLAQDAAATYLALTAAGLQVTALLDARVSERETVLMVS